MAVAVLVAACGSKQGAPGASDPTGGGLTGAPQEDGLGHDTNPQGAPYPTQNLGRAARGTDAAHRPNTTPGSVMPNYKFLGYPGGDSTKGLQTVALADYFDPAGAKYKVIHLIAAASWCGACDDETKALLATLATASTDYRTKGVVYLVALIEGDAANFGATQKDLDLWISTHETPFTAMLDPEAQRLGVFFDADTVPFNADLDARSMEILDAQTGYEDPNQVATWLDFVNANAPAYR
jgi:hypothetical protein